MDIKRWLCACTIATCSISSAYALDPIDSVDLNGNVVTNTSLDDWQNINLGVSSANVSTGVIADLPPKTIFWKGGSKDTLDVTEWWYRDGSVPDKDDLRNGYAAAYFLPTANGDKDLVIYFGAERYANTGDAIMGFWFFQDKVGPGENNKFTGQHIENDLFVIMEYPQGSNSEPFVQIMRWVNGGGDISENLELLYSSGDAGAKCGTDHDPEVACAITNTGGELAGVANGLWAYQSKAGDPDTYPAESFFEGRVNVSKAFANIGPIPCFSSFMIETRSSRSETAQLKDFLGGDFPLCSISVTKTCQASELTADNKFVIDYSIMLTNTGIGNIGTNETITIDDMPSHAAAFQLSNSVVNYDDDVEGWAPNETLTVTGQYISAINGGSNTVDAAVSFGKASITSDQYSVGCDSLALSPMLSIDKTCSLSLDDQGDYVTVRKDYEITVCNTGDVPLDVTLTDSEDTTLDKGFSLDFAKQCLTSNDCSAGNTCEQLDPEDISSPYVCMNSDSVIEGYFGGAVCDVTMANYLPNTIPSGTDGMLSNTANAKATSPITDTGILETEGNSATADCNLCPLTPVEAPQQ